MHKPFQMKSATSVVARVGSSYGACRTKVTIFSDGHAKQAGPLEWDFVDGVPETQYKKLRSTSTPMIILARHAHAIAAGGGGGVRPTCVGLCALSLAGGVGSGGQCSAGCGPTTQRLSSTSC